MLNPKKSEGDPLHFAKTIFLTTLKWENTWMIRQWIHNHEHPFGRPVVVVELFSPGWILRLSHGRFQCEFDHWTFEFARSLWNIVLQESWVRHSEFYCHFRWFVLACETLYIYIYKIIYIYMLEGPPCAMWRPCSFPYFLYFLYLLLETSS